MELRMSLSLLRNIVRKFTGHDLSEHEMITLTRHFSLEQKALPGPPLNTLFSLLQLELKKVHFNSFGDLVRRLRGVDQGNDKKSFNQKYILNEALMFL